MEKKTIAKLAISAIILVLGVVSACGIGKGGLTYQQPGPYTAESSNDFSNVQVAMTIQGDQILDAAITSSGDSDLLTDELRAEWADAIVANQSYENDVISSATLTYSAASVKEAAADIFTQAGLPTPEPAATPEPEPEDEVPAEEAEALTDGTYSVEKTTDFSTINVEMTVEGGKVAAATVTSEGANDLLTDDNRAAWADQIVEKQAVDAISGVTVSSTAVQEAVDELMAQAAGGRAEAAGLADGTYSVEKTTDFSTINVEMTVEGGKVAAATVTSEGANDLLTDDNRAAWADQIVEKQAVDAISGVTVSSTAVQEAVDELLTQAAGGGAEAAGLTDGTYSVEKTTDFSTINVEMTVEGGKVAAATVTSEGANDLLTDDNRAAWADQIVEKQAVDAISGVTVSSTAVQEAVDELLAQAAGSEAAADDVRLAELEAALAEAEAKIAELETANEAAEAKVAELEAAAAAAVVEAVGSETSDISRFMRPRPIAGSEPIEDEAAETDESVAVESGEVAEADASDISRFMRPRPIAGTEPIEDEAAETDESVTVESEEVAEADASDISRFMRPRPIAGSEPIEDEAAETDESIAVESEDVAEAEAPDISRFMRPRPIAGSEPIEDEAAETDESVAVESGEIAEADAPDISRFTRPRPTAISSDEAAEPEAELTEEERLAAILPSIVTTMGDNRENSYVVDYLEQDPYLVNIYEGYGFAKDYGSARGHEYTLEDVAKTQRPHPKANCITCKTPDLHKMIEEQGVAVYSMPFDEVFPQMTTNVSCYTCHGDDMGAGGALKVTHQYVSEALGENVAAINPATLSCGQCHIEYYFTPADSETMMPYHSVDEMTPEAILAYYDDMGFADWTQESTGTAMLKAQHPEMETFLQGKHAAFLSCADCHMPTETTDAGVAYRSHMLVSPLENEALLASCAQCHGDTDMVAFVKDIQDKVTARETEVGNKLSAMKDSLAAAVASGTWSEDDLNAVRKLHREAQWFFDYCYVENSEGAHNSELSMHCLDTSEARIDAAMELLDKQAT